MKIWEITHITDWYSVGYYKGLAVDQNTHAHAYGYLSNENLFRGHEVLL